MIRKADPNRDAEAISNIYKGYVENTTITFETVAPDVEEMRKRISEIGEKYPYLVYVEEGRVAGYCYAHPWKERAAYYPTWETTVYIEQSLQGRGMGKELMFRLMRECKERGVRSLIACITAENETSRKFHEKLGFERVSCFKEVGEKFGRLLDVTDYQKLL